MKRFLYSLFISLLAVTIIPAPLFAADDDEDEPPYVEPAFSVTFNIDNAAAINVAIHDSYGNFKQTVDVVDGDNPITVDPGDYYLVVSVNDGYAFSTFDDNTARTSYLQYERQTTPVTVRKALSTGSGESTLVDGHSFSIRTIDMASQATSSITVDVDNAALIEMRIGTGSNIESGANRTVSLADGINTVSIYEGDTYIHFRAATFMDKIYEASFNDKPVSTDGSFWPTYTIQLKNVTGGGTLIIRANAPQVVDTYSFTVNIDNVSYIRNFYKMPARSDNALVAGEPNTLTFSDGDSYTVWCTRQAVSFKLDGEEVEFDDWLTAYTFTPSDGSVLSIKFDTSGVDLITPANALDNAVFNLQGIMVRPCANDLQLLPPGVYIVNRHKIIVK